jgi:asparagine synthase (glutamine-hydrolysing)
MCGIVGIIAPKHFSLSDHYDAALDKGLSAIERRGPDGHGIWTNSHIRFGHRRLAIIDPGVQSDQPMSSANWTLCYNGEIYNFQKIRSELETLGHKFQTNSDTEVLLLSLEQWGIEGSLERVAGMFAFMAHNTATGISYIARDHMGIKPVVYDIDEEGRYFVGSSVSSVMAMQPGRNFTVNRESLASYFSLGGSTIIGTCYEGITRLAPAHFMTITPDGSNEIKRYWSPQYQPDFSMDDLIEIVREYEISDVKSALFLSGGVDSSFLATIFSSLDCFHLISPEEPYARAVAERFDLKFIAVEPELEAYEDDVEAAIGFHGEPLMSVGIPLAVSREIKRNGYKMAISANGADELFLGYSRTPVPEYTAPYMPLHEPVFYKYFGQQLAHIFRDNRNFEIPALGTHIPSLLEIGQDAMKVFNLESFPPSASYRWLELMTYVLSDLNPTLDAASMYNSIEVRLPFLDHRIVQGVLSWSGEKLVTPSLGRKAPLKQELSKYFPHALYQRAKLGFSIYPENQGTITDLSSNALIKALDDGFIKMTPGKRMNEYERDVIYLGSMLFGYSKWDGRKIIN